jgi:1A family penicillin-binding protein
MTRIKLLLYRKKYGAKRRQLKRLFVLVCWIFIIGCIGVLCAFAYYSKDLPDPEKISQRQIAQSTKIYDRTGEVLLYDIHGEEKRTVIDFDEIPQYMKDATIVSEDDDFYHHFGLDFKGILRAFYANLRGKRISQGGSTITQQFIKNAILTPERTFTRKIKEAILSIELELKYSKDEILGFYLNQVPYGSNAYGIEAAAMTFFDKHARELTLAESALLSVLPRATTYYSPCGSHPEELKIQQEHVLDKMASFGYITKEQSEEAKKEELKIDCQARNMKAPHFVMYVREYLDERYGKDFVEKGGLKVYTTLDWDLQKLAEETVSKSAEYNKKAYNANNEALIAIDPKTGQILTMVGSKDYFGEPSPKNCTPGKNCLFDPNVNVALRPRQPGSSFKPVAYATAFKKGFTPDTIVFDLETEFAVEGAESYKPKNYDGKFRGPITLRRALAQSLNVPSVKVLYLAGVNNTLNTAEDLGITTLKDRSRYGLSLVLGGGEILLLEETSAFGVFAAEGIKHPTASILKIEDSKGNIIEKYEDKPTQVLDVQIARLISDILSDEESRAPIFGSHSKLYLEERPAAVKTGTTQENRDGWTVGYTPSLVVGVWAGNNDNTPMPKGDGLYVAAPTWNEFMKRAYEIKSQNDNDIENYFSLPKEVENFTKPDPIVTNKDILNGKFANEVKVKIDKVSGKLATEFTPPDLIEEKIYREVHCILYYVDKNNPQGESNGRNDSQFNNWEPPVIAWALSPERKEIYNVSPPQEYDDIHTRENQPSVQINSPQNNEIITTRTIEIKASARAVLGIKQLDFFLDNNLIGTDTIEPYQITFNLPDDIKGKKHQITVRAYDRWGARKSETINIILDIPGIEDVKEINEATLSLASNKFPYEFKVTLRDEDGNLLKKELKRIDLYYREAETGEEDSMFAVSLNPSYPDYEYGIRFSETMIPGNYYFFVQVIDKNNSVVKSNNIPLRLE